ncbi:DUF1801 domain-containing protein [Aerococcaceae bacterium 50-4]
MDLHFEDLQKVLNKIDSDEHRRQFSQVITWIAKNYPDFDLVIKWQQPHFEYKETFIIGLNTAKQHMSFFIEKAGIRQFSNQIEKAGYAYTESMYKVKWTDEMDYDLLKAPIDFQVEDKKGMTTYWRKAEED